MHRDITTQALWDHEREEILAALGVEEINPRAWSTDALVEKIKDSIDGREPLLGKAFTASCGTDQTFDVTLDEIEDWLDDVPLFDASTQMFSKTVRKLQGVIRARWDQERQAILHAWGLRTTTLIGKNGRR
jgi:hypothetical protein